MARHRSSRGMTALAAALLLPAVLVACGPVPVDQAERACLRELQDSRPRSSVSIGVGAGGGDVRPYGSVSFDISSDSLTRRDPAEKFARCVQRQSGRLPSVPLSDQPGWQG